MTERLLAKPSAETGQLPAIATIDLPAAANASPPARSGRWRPYAWAAAALAVCALLDTIVFRSGLYQYAIEPESTAGTVVLARFVAASQYRRDMDNVLVIGDSRIGEGFSSVIANRIGRARGLNFVALGVAGSTPRVWSYLLRDIDPQRNRYAAILLMVSDLDDTHLYEHFADRQLDTSYLAPILQPRDLLEFPQSFDDPQMAQDAARAILLPSSSLQSDLFNFLRSPGKRLRKAAQWRKGIGEWASSYPGRTDRLPDLSPGNGRIEFPPDMSEKLRAELTGYFANHSVSTILRPSEEAANYRLRWLGKISHDYASHATRLFSFPIPRGPFHEKLGIPAEISGSLLQLDSSNCIDFLHEMNSSALEAPAYFFDSLHLNRDGRQKFSRELALAFIEHNHPGTTK